MPGDSCVVQLVSITREIYKFFDEDHEIRSVSPDISKAFNEAWHDGIISRLTQRRNIREIIQALAWFFKWEKTSGKIKHELRVTSYEFKSVS